MQSDGSTSHRDRPSANISSLFTNFGWMVTPLQCRPPPGAGPGAVPQSQPPSPNPQAFGTDKQDVIATQLPSTEGVACVYIPSHRLRIEKWKANTEKQLIFISSAYTRPYQPQALVDAEQWIAQILDPVRQKQEEKLGTLYLPELEYPEGADVACLHSVMRMMPLGQSDDGGDDKKVRPLHLPPLWER